MPTPNTHDRLRTTDHIPVPELKPLPPQTRVDLLKHTFCAEVQKMYGCVVSLPCADPKHARSGPQHLSSFPAKPVDLFLQPLDPFAISSCVHRLPPLATE